MPGTLAALDAEWRFIARSPAARRALQRWGRTEGALTLVADLDAVLGVFVRRASEEEHLAGGTGCQSLQTLGCTPRQRASRVLLR